MVTLSNVLNEAKRQFPASLQYIRAFLEDYSVATIAPSSRYTVNQICTLINFNCARAIIDLGAGEGVITRALCEHAADDARLFAIELNESLAQLLEDSIHDRRVSVVNADARAALKKLRGKGKFADVIISGIPFSHFSSALASEMLAEMAHSLSAGGALILYQAWMPPIVTPRRVKQLLSRDFTVEFTTEVYRNVPPLQIILARKRSKEMLSAS